MELLYFYAVLIKAVLYAERFVRSIVARDRMPYLAHRILFAPSALIVSKSTASERSTEMDTHTYSIVMK